MDTSKTLDSKVFGTEVEHGVTFVPDKGETKKLLFAALAGMVVNEVNTLGLPTAHGDSSNYDFFLWNGARLYVDYGHRIEYSTPECDNIVELVAHEKAGERILADLCRRVEVRLRDLGYNGKIHLYKNNSAMGERGKYVSWGWHGNILIPNNNSWKNLSKDMIAFYVVRTLLAGRGAYVPTDEDNPIEPHIEISDRARFFNTSFGADSMENRAIFYYRDEPWADKKRFRRNHDIVADSNMSEYATALKMATTLMAFGMIERGIFPRVTLIAPDKALKDISRDLTLSEYVETADGRKTALEILRGYYEIAKASSFLQELPDPFMRERLLPMLEDCLSGLENLASKPLALFGKLDWITSKYILEAARKKKSDKPWQETADDELREYSRIYPTGSYEQLVERDRSNNNNGKVPVIKRVCTDADIENAMKNPPQTTRAVERVRLMTENPNIIRMTWGEIRVSTATGIENYRSYDPRVPEFRLSCSEYY